MAGEISTNPAWRARRRRKVLGPLLLGLTLLALAGWAYRQLCAWPVDCYGRRVAGSGRGGSPGLGGAGTAGGRAGLTGW